MNKKSRKHLQEALDKDPSCYVLITCGQPSPDGNMQVEMTYQGDTSLASYLIQGAQYYIDQEEAIETLEQPKLRIVNRRS
jgi:hypothetical protein